MTQHEESAMHKLASHATALAERRLVDGHRDRVNVHSCFHYGAVDIDSRYLVVWIILTGAPDEELPEWSTPESAGLQSKLDPGLVSWMEHLRRVVRDQFSAVDWPDADNVSVLFDSEHRIRENGGWEYFK